MKGGGLGVWVVGLVWSPERGNGDGVPKKW